LHSIQTGTTTELNLADYFRSNNMSYEPVAIETNEEGQVNYLAGRCDVYTTDASGLAATRGTFDNPNGHVILPEIISKEPLGPAVRQGDDQWADVTRWVLNVLIAAEEAGLTQARAISAVGNYGEIFERNIGVNTPLGLARGLNAQWTNGGILYAPPVR
jgi:general L-amino acid transport system substrate-binding protein